MFKPNAHKQTLRWWKLLSLMVGLFLCFGWVFAYAQDCQLLAWWSPATLTNGHSLTGYSSPDATYTQSCTGLQGIITCNNGTLTNGNTYRYQSCTPHTWANCSTPRTGNHLENKLLYKLSQATYTQTCQQVSQSFQCLNGSFTGPNISLFPYGTCTDVAWQPCINTWTNTYVAHGGTIIGYTNPSAQNCQSAQVTLTCQNQQWMSGSTVMNQANLFPSCGWTNACTLPWWGTLNNGLTTYWYSTVLRAVTWQNYIGGCPVYSGSLLCTGGVLQWNAALYKYSLAQCNVGVPQSCTLPRWNTLPHGASITGYSSTTVSYPDTCDSVATTLSCINGNLNGNRQTYTNQSCSQGSPLFNGLDIEISSGFTGLPGGWDSIAQWSSPMINIVLRNNGTTLINTPAAAGFVTCKRDEQGITVYSSPDIWTLVINPWTKIGLPVQLSNIFTQVLWDKTISCTVTLNGDQQTFNNDWKKVYSVTVANRFDLAMQRSIDSIKGNLEPAEAALGTQGVQNFVFTKVMSFLVPLIVVIGILIAILWFYKIMFSGDDKAVSEWTKYVIYGLVGIIVIMSAKYIGSNIYGILTVSTDIKWYQIAQSLYDKLAYPFIKFAIYLVLGAMFVILLTRVMSFLFGSDTDAKKKAWTLIGRNIIGMLVIIWAKQIVEAVYGKYTAVVKDISNLGEIGSGVLADKQIPLVYTVVNRVLGLTALVILILIIVQTIQLLLKPSDEKQMTSVKNSLMYMLIGLLVIGTGYLIVNFLIIN